MTTNFVETKPTLESYWRSVILFGRNVASYKFALGRALLDLSSRPSDLVTLEDLAEPYAKYLCEHLGKADRQGTFAKSKFLDTCRAFNRGELGKDRLRTSTVRLGFNNVIDAFHVVNQGEISTRFFLDERRGTKKAIRLTEELRALSEGFQMRNLPGEVEARWRLVETAWELDLPSHLLSVSYDSESEQLFAGAPQGRRKNITACRDALNGYQRGRCFYCRAQVAATKGAVDVDHFLPHALKQHGFKANLDGLWNLVLACVDCNRGSKGKWARVPELRFLDRLYQRGEYLIGSQLPLREALMSQTGATSEERRSFLQDRWNEARALLIHTWAPEQEEDESL